MWHDKCKTSIADINKSNQNNQFCSRSRTAKTKLKHTKKNIKTFRKINKIKN